MATASIDAKLLKLQNVQMSNKESIVKYVIRLESMINELFDTGHGFFRTRIFVVYCTDYTKTLQWQQS